MSYKSDLLKKLESMPDDEPVFLLRAQDGLSDEFVDAWAMRARQHQVHSDKVLGAINIAEDMRRWIPRRLPD